MVLFMKANGRMACEMAKELSAGLMEANILVNGKIIG
jgi:hypothetical protein